MTKKIESGDIRRLCRFADEDRECAYVAADEEDWEAFDGFMACVRAHETNALALQTTWVQQNRAA